MIFASENKHEYEKMKIHSGMISFTNFERQIYDAEWEMEKIRDLHKRARQDLRINTIFVDL